MFYFHVMDTLMEVLKTFLAGTVLGAVFMLLKLPIPAPNNVAGIMGIVGVFVGYVLVKKTMG